MSVWVQLGDLRRIAGQGGRLGKNTDTTMWWLAQVKKIRGIVIFLSCNLSAGKKEIRCLQCEAKGIFYKLTGLLF